MRGTYSSPGLGGSTWPCETADEAENVRLCVGTGQGCRRIEGTGRHCETVTDGGSAGPAGLV